MKLNKTVTLKIPIFLLLTTFALCMFIFTSFSSLDLFKENKNITCRSDMKIIAANASFEGTFTYKLGSERGIANIIGYITSKSGDEYSVERTVLLSFSNYGISPVWTSNNILISKRDSVPLTVADEVFPNFYLKPSEHSDIDMININESSFLFTIAGMPYQYCRKMS